MPKPFYLKKRFLVAVGALILGAVGVKNPELVAGLAADAYSAAEGHSPE